ncbi:MAG: hypothetical protein KatS3mg131_2814 [Candidatus Tectimicrobiota bacterium]|nr:MAG: hypothetical protein KatS3mg131_2814 [Candidatus Tectomicrobia bacterium]
MKQEREEVKPSASDWVAQLQRRVVALEKAAVAPEGSGLLETMAALTTALITEPRLAVLLQRLVEQAVGLIPAADTAMLFLWDAERERLVPEVWYGTDLPLPRIPLRLGEGVTGTVALRRQGLLVTDYLHSPYALPVFAEHFGPHAVLAEPLLHGAQLVGVLVLNNFHRQVPFTPRDQQLLALLATQAAAAIATARLREARQRHLERLRTLTHLLQHITASL